MNMNMKKVLLLLIVVFAGCMVNAQEIRSKGMSEKKQDKKIEVKWEDAIKQKAKIKQKAQAKIQEDENINHFELTPSSKIISNEKSTANSLFFEDFENAPEDGTFPSGWTNIPTPGGGSEWTTMRIQGGAGVIPGHSGIRYANILFHETLAKDAWLYTPAIALEAGTSYTISFWVQLIGWEGVGENLEVKIGNSTTAASMTHTLYDNNSQDYSVWTKITATYLPTASGNFHVGFHAYTPAGINCIMLDDVEVTVAIEKDVEITDITSPVSGTNLTNAETVKAKIRNNGILGITNFSLKLELNGTEVATETYLGTIAAGAEVEYTFTAAVDLSAVQNHTIKVTAILTGDEVGENNVKEKTVANYGNVAVMGSVDEITSCGIKFYDDGVAGNYTFKSGDQLITFYPETAGKMVRITFNELVTVIDPIGLVDAIFVLNGVFTTDDFDNITDDDILGGFAGDYTGALPEPMSALNADGALTVSFVVGNWYNLTASGWDADIDCVDPLGKDAELFAITEPVSRANMGNETVKVIIKNNGSENITGLSLKLELNGTEVATETFSGTIHSFGKAEHTFAQTVDLSAARDHTIKVTVNLTGDELASNDSKTATITNTICNNITSFPWTEGFETSALPPTGCWTLYSASGSTDWLLNTDSRYVKQGSQSLYHADARGAQNAWLISPKISVPTTGNYVIKFWSYNTYPSYYVNGAKNSVLVSTTSNNPATDNFEELWTASSVDESWVETIIPLADYLGMDIYIAFRYEGDFAHAWYIDELTIEDFELTDVEVAAIIEPDSGINMGNEKVRITIKNNGSNDITACSLKLEVDGTEVATETYSGTIASLSRAEYTFTQTVDLSAEGEHTIKVTVNLANDEVADNNSIEKTIKNTICSATNTLPWSDSFENGMGCWHIKRTNANKTWYIGATIAPVTGVNTLNIDYDESTAQQNEYAISPEFDLSGISGDSNLEFGFYFSLSYYWSVDPNNNYDLFVKGSTDGQNWTTLWDETTYGPFGNFDAMHKATIDVSQYAGQPKVWFAFVYVGKNGAAAYIDDVSLTVKKHEIEYTQLTPENNATNVENNATVSATFNKNIEANDLTGITITPKITGISASIDGKVLTIAHDNFAYDTEYTVNIPANAIKEYAQPITWKFTTRTVSVDNTKSDPINIYPNPSDGLVNIRVSEKSLVKITDITGKILNTIEVNEHEQINFTHVPGVYFIHIENNGKVYTQKLIVE
jgi:hypothetical protein